MERSPFPAPEHTPSHAQNEKMLPSAQDDVTQASVQDHATQTPSQDGMTQASFDRLTSVVSANECTGLVPSGQLKDDVHMYGELGGSMLQGENSQPQ